MAKRVGLITAIFVLWSAVWLIHNVKRQSPTFDLVAAPSGEQLPSLFAGLNPNPEYRGRGIVRRTRGSCGTEPSGLAKWIPQLRGLFQTTVHAEGNCSSTPCAGNYWQNYSMPCPSGVETCNGSYNNGWDGGRFRCKGIRNTGYIGCDDPVTGCPCDWITCSYPPGECQP
jgi:hypothetical protein